MKKAYLGRAKAIAGAGLLGIGIFLMHQELASVAAQVRHVLGVDDSGVGVPFAVIQLLSQAAQAYGDHRWFLQRFLPHMLLSSWPLLLINIGSAWSRDTFKENGNLTAKKGLCNYRFGQRPFDVKIEADLKTQNGRDKNESDGDR